VPKTLLNEVIINFTDLPFAISAAIWQGAAIRRINDQTQYSKNAMLTGSKLVKMTSLGVI
jgi:hypothetical protein